MAYYRAFSSLFEVENCSEDFTLVELDTACFRASSTRFSFNASLARFSPCIFLTGDIVAELASLSKSLEIHNKQTLSSRGVS